MVKAYTDGACRISNPGLCSCAWVVVEGESVLCEGAFFLGPELHTNNYAEYQGLIKLLEYINGMGVKNVDIASDSALIVNQVNGKWSTEKKPELAKLCSYATALKVIGGHTLRHIRGHGQNEDGVDNLMNNLADEMCNKILDEWMEKHGEAVEEIRSSR